MEITLEQFCAALGDSTRRAQLGISMSDQEALDVLADEADIVAYFQIWEQDRGRKPANARHWQPTAVVGFVLALTSILAAGIAFLPFGPSDLVGWIPIGIVAAIVLSANGLSASTANGTRGRRLSIWGIALGSVALLGGIVLLIGVVSS